MLATVRRRVVGLVVLPPSVGVDGNDIVVVRVDGTTFTGNTTLRVESSVTTGVDLRRRGRAGVGSGRRRGGGALLLRRGRRGGSTSVRAAGRSGRLVLLRRGGSTLLGNVGNVVDGSGGHGSGGLSRSGHGSGSLGRSSHGSSNVGRSGHGSSGLGSVARSVVVLRLGLDVGRCSSGGSSLGDGGIDRGDSSRVGSAVRSTVVGKSLSGEERVTAVVEEGGVVLGVTRESKVPGVVCAHHVRRNQTT